MENLDKVDKLLRQFPHGAKATELARKLGVSRSAIYDQLNSLEARGKARNEHALWYPTDPAQSSSEKPTFTLEAAFLVDKSKIREDFVNGQLDRAYTRTRLLVDSGKVSKEWHRKHQDLLKTLDAELQATENITIEQFNLDRRRRIKKLEQSIVSEALKHWS